MKTERLSVLQMKSNIDKAINYLQLYKLSHEPEYLVMANKAIIKESQVLKKARDTAISKAR